jgi:hypothetical protein
VNFILVFRHFGDQKVKGTEALDIGTLRVLKPEIPFRGKFHGHIYRIS